MSSQPVALSIDLGAGQVMRARVGDADVAVWRSASGVLSAWENRCPHRGMRLSYGFVRGESLACAYHGWHFACSGQCHYMPAHPELQLPRTIKPTLYSAAESGGLVWVNAEGEACAAPVPEKLSPLRSVSVDGPVEQLFGVLDGSELTVDSVVYSFHPETEQANVLNASSTEGVSGLHIALQHAGDARSVAHVLVGDAFTDAARIAVSRWCDALRRQVESG